jgi:hypothetical protein
MCEIEGTGTVYDGKKIPGVVDKSCFVPNCRPNFFDKTGYYVITLHASWYGYPEPHKLGSVSFAGINDATSDDSDLPDWFAEHIAAGYPQYELKNDGTIIKRKLRFLNQKYNQKYNQKTHKCGMSSRQIWKMIIILGLFIVIAIELKNNL